MKKISSTLLKALFYWLYPITFFYSSQTALAVNCDMNCHEQAMFKYSCPSFKNPSRMCWGKNAARVAACETTKAASCKAWNGAVNFFSDKVKPIIGSRFNSKTYSKAVYDGETAQYMAYCTAAAAASCTVLGAEFGGPYGAILGGAGGAFISYQICKQSTRW